MASAHRRIGSNSEQRKRIPIYTGFIKYSYSKNNLSILTSARIFDEKQSFKIDKNYFGENDQ